VLINLAQAAQGEMGVLVELVYVAPGPPAWDQAVALEGPQFDLPLNDVRWVLFLPTDYRYTDFGGTLSADLDTQRRHLVQAYDANVYEADISRLNVANTSRARDLQNAGQQMAVTGNNAYARQYFLGAVNYSLSDSNLNEDARVQLNNLTKTQALVGLVQSRNNLRILANAGTPVWGGSAGGVAGEDLGDRFSLDQAQKIKASLSSEDVGNLEAITNKVVDQQALAAGAEARLTINMPLRGRVLSFSRAHQVDRDEPMQITMSIEPAPAASPWRFWGPPICILAALAVVFYGVPMAARKWAAVRTLFPARIASVVSIPQAPGPDAKTDSSSEPDRM
jgi:hypothetical protein